MSYIPSRSIEEFAVLNYDYQRQKVELRDTPCGSMRASLNQAQLKTRPSTAKGSAKSTQAFWSQDGERKG